MQAQTDLQTKNEFFSLIAQGGKLKMEEDGVGAMKFYREAVNLCPFHYESYVELGVGFMSIKQPIYALRSFQYGLDFAFMSFEDEASSERVQGYYREILLGLMNEVNESWIQARSHYKKATKLYNQGFYGAFSVGVTYGYCFHTNVVENSRKASKWNLRSIELLHKDPHSARYWSFFESVIYTNMGRVQHGGGYFYDALHSSSTAIQLRNANIQAHLIQAKVYNSMLNPEKALENYEYSIQFFLKRLDRLELTFEVDPRQEVRDSIEFTRLRTVEIINDKAYCLSNLSMDKAKEEGQRAIQLFPSYSPLPYIFLADSRPPEVAISVLSQGIEASSGKDGIAHLYDYRAELYKSISMPEEAAKDQIRAEHSRNQVRYH